MATALQTKLGWRYSDCFGRGILCWEQGRRTTYTDWYGITAGACRDAPRKFNPQTLNASHPQPRSPLSVPADIPESLVMQIEHCMSDLHNKKGKTKKIGQRINRENGFVLDPALSAPFILSTSSSVSGGAHTTSSTARRPAQPVRAS